MHCFVGSAGCFVSFGDVHLPEGHHAYGYKSGFDAPIKGEGVAGDVHRVKLNNPNMGGESTGAIGIEDTIGTKTWSSLNDPVMGGKSSQPAPSGSRTGSVPRRSKRSST